MTYKTHAQGTAAKPEGGGAAARAPRKAGTPRFLQHAIARAVTARPLPVSRPGDGFEREADRVSHRVRQGGEPVRQAAAAALQPAGPAASHPLRSGGRALDPATRASMEPSLGADLGHVRLHTDSQAAALNRDLGAKAFTLGSDIFFGAGHGPGDDNLLAHELTHAVQQSGGARGGSAGPVSATGGQAMLQRSLTGSFPVTQGGFEIDLQTREGAVNKPPTHSGLDGYIRFIPSPAAPNSNEIDMIQIVKLTDLGGADVSPASLPAAQAPRGALGTPGLRTEDNPFGGVEGGFFTDVHHQPNVGGPAAPPGSALSPNYNFQPAAPGTAGTVGQTQQPAFYGGGVGGVVGQTPGFKRSGDAADIRSAALYDTPGVADPAWNLDFAFESAARGADTGVVYGSVLWGFGLRAGRVINERVSVVDAASATFAEALERHRDFYVHEPVTFYFEFNRDVLSPTEAAKIDEFLPYLARNPDVELALEGFADIVGGAGTYNSELSLRRAQAVEGALLARGVAAARINGIMIGRGASTAATTNAGTGDQGGNPAVGADQMREANRWANRRVVLTFTHVPGAGAAPGPTPAPAGP